MVSMPNKRVNLTRRGWCTMEALGAGEEDLQLVPRVGELIVGVREAYKPFVAATGSSQPTDTLITKVILMKLMDMYFGQLGYERD